MGDPNLFVQFNIQPIWLPNHVPEDTNPGRLRWEFTLSSPWSVSSIIRRTRNQMVGINHEAQVELSKYLDPYDGPLGLQMVMGPLSHSIPPPRESKWAYGASLRKLDTGTKDQRLSGSRLRTHQDVESCWSREEDAKPGLRNYEFYKRLFQYFFTGLQDDVEFALADQENPRIVATSCIATFITFRSRLSTFMYETDVDNDQFEWFRGELQRMNDELQDQWFGTSGLWHVFDDEEIEDAERGGEGGITRQGERESGIARGEPSEKDLEIQQ